MIVLKAALIIASFVVGFAGLVTGVVGLLNWMSAPSKRDLLEKERWRGAAVVRICRDGTFIYRLRDGELWTGGISQKVTGSDPSVICER